MSQGIYRNKRLTETNSQLQNKQTNQEENTTPFPETASLSCYSDKIPPEIDSLVVVKVEQVDEYGIWGSLPDWGPTFKAYLPMQSMARVRGRGERRAQHDFYTRTRRRRAKGHHQIFVGNVQDAQQVTNNAVDCLNVDAPVFHLTVTRRGVTDEEETATTELSRSLHRCANLLVDKAAHKANVSQAWARELVLHEPYYKAVQILRDEDRDVQPEKAAVHLLLALIGKLSVDSTSEVLSLLESNVLKRVTAEEALAFASALLVLCRDERQRQLKPVVHSLSCAIGGRREIAKMLAGRDYEHLSDLRLVTAALSTAESVALPEGCEPVTISVKGSGKYTFSTKASPQDAKMATSFLEAVVSHVQQTWRKLAGSLVQGKQVVQGGLVFDKPDQSSNLMQPSLNIGIIGDVANGKSTLVKAMSGKRTQSHSSEKQQHGITIRLGFANTVVLRCGSEVCGSCTFFPEVEDKANAKLPRCIHCKGQMHVAKRVSFIDCPGHTELMATMLAGASAFDAVILAAAANVPCPTPQAKQHLEAIKLSGAVQPSGETIAIAQTKAELIASPSVNVLSKLSPSERLASHANQGRDKLQKTVAAKAPFFPVCSPLGLGLDPLADWIANLDTIKSRADGSGPARLNVLRSFDVNHPGNNINGIVGGVLGGTISGSGAIAVGDKLEVRPGIFLAPKKKRMDTISNSKKEAKEQCHDQGSENTGGPAAPFRVQHLSCYCTTLMTGKTSLASATKGGLVAVGTTLCPSLCTSNGLVGAVVGLSGTLPPVWGPNLFLEELELVSLVEEHAEANKGRPLGPSDILKKAAAVRCHFGSATSMGQVVRLSKRTRKIQVEIESPVCASKGSSVAVEARTPKGSFLLVAHARISCGDVCVEGVETAETSTHDSVLETHEQQQAEDRPFENDASRRSEFLADLEAHNRFFIRRRTSQACCPYPPNQTGWRRARVGRELCSHCSSYSSRPQPHYFVLAEGRGLVLRPGRNGQFRSSNQVEKRPRLRRTLPFHPEEVHQNLCDLP